MWGFEREDLVFQNFFFFNHFFGRNTIQLSGKFRSFTGTRSDYPLSDEEIARVAPSIFADGKHQNRSERYAV